MRAQRTALLRITHGSPSKRAARGKARVGKARLCAEGKRRTRKRCGCEYPCGYAFYSSPGAEKTARERAAAPARGSRTDAENFTRENCGAAAVPL